MLKLMNDGATNPKFLVFVVRSVGVGGGKPPEGKSVVEVLCILPAV